jgi:hypothetical protein
LSYNIKFDVQQQGAETIDQIARMMQNVQRATQATSAELKAFEAVVRAEVAAGNSLSEALKSISSSAQGVPQNLRDIASAAQSATTNVVEIDVAARNLGNTLSTHTVPQMAAASGAIRTAFGDQSIRAVERFAVTTLGLGPIMQAAFPLIGAFAFGEMLVSLLEKIDPLTKAEKALAQTTKEVDADFERLAKHIEGLQIKQITDELGKARGQNLARFYSDSDALRDKAAIADLDRQITEVQKKLAPFQLAKGIADSTLFSGAYTMLGSIPGIGPEKYRAGYETKLRDLQAKRDDLGFKGTDATQQSATDAAAEHKDAIEEAKRRAAEAKAAAREATQALSQADQLDLDDLKASHEVTLTETVSFWEKRLAAESSNAERYRAISNTLGHLYQDQNRVYDEAVKKIRQTNLEEEKQAAEHGRKMANMFQELDDMAQAQAAKVAETAVKVANIRDKNAENETIGGLNQQRLGARRAGGLTPIGSTPEESAAIHLDELRKITDIDRQEAQIRLQIEVGNLERIRAEYGATSEQYATQQGKVVEINQSANQKIYEDTTATLEAIHNEQKRKVEEFRSTAGEMFSALLGGSSGITGFLKSQVEGIGKTIFENIAQEAMPAIDKLIPHAKAGTPLGNILHGTKLGPQDDPLKTAGVTLTTAGDKLSAAADKLSGVGGGGGTGAGSIPGLSGGGTAQFGSDLTPEEAAWLNGTSSPSSGIGAFISNNAGKIMGAAAAGAGAFAAFSDFRSGGAKNDIAGVGAGLGSAAGVLAMTGVGAPVALGLGIAAAATSLIASFLPDPKKLREDAITKHLAQAQYIAPESLNVQQDSSGNYMDFDSRGNIRQSSFRASPQVLEPYLHWHGGTDGTQGFYNVPGRVTSPFGANSQAPINVTINAIDQASFAQFAQRNANVIGEAAATHLQNTDGRLAKAIQFITVSR